MADILDLVDVQELRNEVQKKYREVAEKPGGTYHFHTVRKYAIRLGYDRAILDQLPNEACEGLAACLAMLWFAGIQTTPAKGSPGTHDVSSPRPFAGAHSLKNRRLRQQSQTAVKRVRRRKSGSLKYRISADSEYEYRMVDLSSQNKNPLAAIRRTSLPIGVMRGRAGLAGCVDARRLGRPNGSDVAPFRS